MHGNIIIWLIIARTAVNLRKKYYQRHIGKLRASIIGNGGEILIISLAGLQQSVYLNGALSAMAMSNYWLMISMHFFRLHLIIYSLCRLH